MYSGSGGSGSFDASGVAPYQGGEQPDVVAKMQSRYHQIAWSRMMLLMLLSLGIATAVMKPLWQILRMTAEPAVVYFVGTSLVQWVAIVCLVMAVAYVGIMVVVFRSGSHDQGQVQTIITVTVMMASLFGLALLMLSFPLTARLSEVHEEMYFGCQYGRDTQRLYENSQELQMLRSTPACSAKESVEDCDGFSLLDTPGVTGFLKTMESHYHCSGFCFMVDTRNATGLKPRVMEKFDGSKLASAASKQMASSSGIKASSLAALLTSAGAAGQLASGKAEQVRKSAVVQDVADRRLASPQRTTKSAEAQRLSNSTFRSSLTRSRLAVALTRLSKVAPRAGELDASEHDPDISDTVAMLQLRAYTTESDAGPPAQPQVGQVGPYPPALFSRTQNKVSCDGAAVRALKYVAIDGAMFFYWEGLILLIVGVLVNLTRVGALCIEGIQGSRAEAAQKAQGQCAGGPGQQPMQ